MLQNARNVHIKAFLFVLITVVALLLIFTPPQNFHLPNFFLAQEEAQKVKNPHVTLKESAYNFGTINQGEEIRYELTIKNVDKSPFVIKQLITELGLKVNLPEYKVIKPNEPFKVMLFLNSNSFEGEVVKRLKILTSEPEVKPLVFELKGEIIPRVESNPKFIKFDKSNNYAQKKVSLRINGDMQASKLEVTIPSNKFIKIQREDKKNNIHLFLTIMQNKMDMRTPIESKECSAQRLVLSYPENAETTNDAKNNLEKRYKVIPIYIDCEKNFVKNS